MEHTPRPAALGWRVRPPRPTGLRRRPGASARAMRMAPARSSQIRPFARGTATGPREAVEARGRPTRTDARRPHGCNVHVPAAGWGSPPPTTAYPQHDPGGCPDGHATGARARPRLRLRSPGRDRVPGRTVPAADTPRRRSCRNRDRCGRTRARRTARVQRASHRPRTRVEAGASCYGASHVDRTSDVLRSDSSTTKRGTAVRCTTGVFRSSVRMY